MKSAAIRQAFLDYFHERDHTVVASSALIPADDPTLLFTNAGMVQFKDVFLGKEKRSYTRAVTSQRCVRAGGKHNDLENVGHTARHHTFFEMLGNFSFGDYFKREAIAYAWDFLTHVLKVPADKLWVTVFEEDDETASIWLDEMKIDPRRFSRCGEKDNFWAMGATGPCGPCTEIFYDHGPEIAGGPPGTPEEDGDRYVEIWNLVFMQYSRDAAGKITSLPKPSVDTGMGLERIAAVMQGVHNNYDTDLFQPLIKVVAQLAHVSDLSATSLRVIADHIRSAVFLLMDGIVPSNEGRGYVLRRIIRRALRHGHKLGLQDPFFHQLVGPLVQEMGQAYPALLKAKDRIMQALLREEEAFATTLDQGLKIFEQALEKLEGKQIPGDVIFRLYDTYGFPLDLTADIARERHLTVDAAGFHQEMAQQRQRSQQASQFGVDYNQELILDTQSDFSGYEHLQHAVSVKQIVVAGQSVTEIQAGEQGILVLERTPFYAESGGQVGDQGVLTAKNVVFAVADTQKQGDAILHYGTQKQGKITLNDKLDAKVDQTRRQATALNHSATHLLHAALRQLLGEHILQKGSLVDPDKLRFDFSHFEPLSTQQIKAIEVLVNTQIRANLAVKTQLMTPEEAMDSGAMALFGEKYGAEVRVLSMGNFSLELCGGTHVARTGDIGVFKIISETGIAAGIRRIEAVTGMQALAWFEQREIQLKQVAGVLKVNPEHVIDKLEQLLKRERQLSKEVEQLKIKMAGSVGRDLANSAQVVQGTNVLAVQIEHADTKALREILDNLKSKLEPAVIVLATVVEGKVKLIAGVSQVITNRFQAGVLANYVAHQIDGKGGGRPDIAQAGGNNPTNLTAALKSVAAWVAKKS